MNGISRSSDDREPHGTGGIQVLNAINEAKINNVLIVVTRYFGGIRLGAPGLARAYHSCASLLIKNSKIIENCLHTNIRFECSYKEYDRILNSKLFDICNAKFSDKIEIEISVKNSQIDKFKTEIENLLSRKIDLLRSSIHNSK